MSTLQRDTPWKADGSLFSRAVKYPWKLTKATLWRAILGTDGGQRLIERAAKPATTILPGRQCTLSRHRTPGGRDVWQYTIGYQNVMLPSIADNAANLKPGMLSKLREHGLAGDPMARRYEHTGFIEIEPYDHVVDVGGYIGAFAAYAATRSALVHSFEPHPAAHWCLAENTKADGSIRTYDAAAWNSTGSQSISGEVDVSDTTVSENSSEEDTVIRTVRLDEWADSNNIGHVDFLKIDAEGEELAVLEGIGELDVQKIGVDAGEGSATNPRDVEEWLLRRGYDVRRDGHLVYGRR